MQANNGYIAISSSLIFIGSSVLAWVGSTILDGGDIDLALFFILFAAACLFLSVSLWMVAVVKLMRRVD